MFLRDILYVVGQHRLADELEPVLKSESFWEDLCASVYNALYPYFGEAVASFVADPYVVSFLVVVFFLLCGAVVLVIYNAIHLLLKK